jgi:hypothetical protein
LSKTIAQTVGGKRFAWLLALLAVFAVIAASQIASPTASAAGSDGVSLPQDIQGGTQPVAGPDAGDPDWLIPGLYHVSPTGELLAVYVDDYDIAGVDIDRFASSTRSVGNNLIGFEHIICLVPLGEGDDLPDVPWSNEGNEEIGDDLQPDGGDGGIVGIVESPDDYNWYIQTIAGSANIVGAQKIDLDFPYVPFNDNGTPNNPLDDTPESGYVNGDDLPCIRWWSAGAGEQNVTVVDSQGTTAADMADDDDPTTDPFDFADIGDVCPDDNPENDECDNQSHSTQAGTFNGLSGPAIPLVKEWNVLDRKEVTRAGFSGNQNGTVHTVPTLFNPATSRWVALQPVRFVESVFGIHTTATGGTLNPVVAGAR